MSGGHKPKEQLNSTGVETEPTPLVELKNKLDITYVLYQTMG